MKILPISTLILCATYVYKSVKGIQLDGKARRFISNLSIFSSISDIRKEYSNKGLNDNAINDDPFELFRIWFEDVSF